MPAARSRSLSPVTLPVQALGKAREQVGDGNLQYSIYPASLPRGEVDELVYRPLAAVSGSVSAEHGIGLEKKPSCITRAAPPRST